MPADLGGWNDVLSAPERIETYRTYVEEQEASIGAFLEFEPERLIENDRDVELGDELSTYVEQIAGVPFAVKDNIAVKGYRLTCGSKMLEGLSSPYNATAVDRLIAAGAKVVGKTNLDEFGMGSSTDDSALGETNNPWDTMRVPGGSSGGSAAAVASGSVPFALGSDTGGSVRQPASFCGVLGLKPTYGTVSRYGLVAYASSLEVIGVLAEDVSVMKAAYRIMRGSDDLDHSSLDPDSKDKSTLRPENAAIGVLGGDLGLDADTARGYEACKKQLQALGCTLYEVEIPTLEYVVPAYYTIATAEASANLARFNGIRYGHRPVWAENPEELVRKSRNEGFGDEVKLRVLLGTFVLRSGFQDQYYVRAQKIRTAIRNDIDAVFEKADMILMPTFPTVAFPHGDAGLSPFQQKVADRFTATANLTGIPAMSFPSGADTALPAGMQLMAPAFCEDRLFATVEAYCSSVEMRHPSGYSAEWRT